MARETYEQFSALCSEPEAMAALRLWAQGLQSKRLTPQLLDDARRSLQHRSRQCGVPQVE